jgi:hypothetical protein
MSRTAAILSGILVLALMAGGFTEATLAIGRRGGIADDTLLRPGTAHSPSPTPSASTSPKASVTPTPTATATPSPTPAGPVATTNSFVHLRAGKSTSTAVLTDLDGGTAVRLLPDSDAQWQQVEFNGVTGYVFKTYLVY